METLNQLDTDKEDEEDTVGGSRSKVTYFAKSWRPRVAFYVSQGFSIFGLVVAYFLIFQPDDKSAKVVLL